MASSRRPASRSSRAHRLQLSASIGVGCVINTNHHVDTDSGAESHPAECHVHSDADPPHSPDSGQHH